MKKKVPLSRKLFSGIFYLFSSSLVTIGIKTLIIALIARKLGVENFGLYSAIISFVGLFEFLSDFGLNKTLLKFGSTNKENASISFGNALLVKSFLILPVLIIAGSAAYFSGYRGVDFLSLILFTLSSVFDTYASIFSSIRRITGSFKLISFFRIVKTVLTLIVIIIVLSKYQSVFSLAVATLSLTMIMFLASLINTIMLLRPRLKLSLLSEFFKDSIIFSFNDFFLNIYGRIGIVLLSFFHEMFSVGIYGAAVRFTIIASLLPRQIRFAMLPTMYRLLENPIDSHLSAVASESDILEIAEEKIEGKELVSHNKAKSKLVFNILFKYMILFSVPLALSIFYFSDSIIHLIFGKKYFSSIPYVQLFSLFIFLRFIETPFTLFYLGMNKHKNLVVFQGIASLLNVILCFALIPEMAAFGAVYSTILSELVFAFIIVFAGINYKIWNLKDLTIQIFKPFFACLISAWFIYMFLPTSHIIFQLLSMYFLYIAFLFVVRTFDEEDKKLFKKIFTKVKAKR